MAKRPRTQNELLLWWREYEQVKQEWSEWYRANQAHHKTIKDAWIAFKAQCHGNTNVFDLDSVFSGRNRSS